MVEDSCVYACLAGLGKMKRINVGEILASMSKGKEKAHKRTISEVIPREEREVEREKETAQVNGDSEVNEIAQIDKDNAPSGLRRSGRAPKPSKRR